MYNKMKYHEIKSLWDTPDLKNFNLEGKIIIFEWKKAKVIKELGRNKIKAILQQNGQEEIKKIPKKRTTEEANLLSPHYKKQEFTYKTIKAEQTGKYTGGKEIEVFKDEITLLDYKKNPEKYLRMQKKQLHEMIEKEIKKLSESEEVSTWDLWELIRELREINIKIKQKALNKKVSKTLERAIKTWKAWKNSTKFNSKLSGYIEEGNNLESNVNEYDEKLVQYIEIYKEMRKEVLKKEFERSIKHRKEQLKEEVNTTEEMDMKEKEEKLRKLNIFINMIIEFDKYTIDNLKKLDVDTTLYEEQIQDIKEKLKEQKEKLQKKLEK